MDFRCLPLLSHMPIISLHSDWTWCHSWSSVTVTRVTRKKYSWAVRLCWFLRVFAKAFVSVFETRHTWSLVPLCPSSERMQPTPHLNRMCNWSSELHMMGILRPNLSVWWRHEKRNWHFALVKQNLGFCWVWVTNFMIKSIFTRKNVQVIEHFSKTKFLESSLAEFKMRVPSMTSLTVRVHSTSRSWPRDIDLTCSGVTTLRNKSVTCSSLLHSPLGHICHVPSFQERKIVAKTITLTDVIRAQTSDALFIFRQLLDHLSTGSITGFRVDETFCHLISRFGLNRGRDRHLRVIMMNEDSCKSHHDLFSPSRVIWNTVQWCAVHSNVRQITIPWSLTCRVRGRPISTWADVLVLFRPGEGGRRGPAEGGPAEEGPSDIHTRT